MCKSASKIIQTQTKPFSFSPPDTRFMGLTLTVYKNNDKFDCRLVNPHKRPETESGFNTVYDALKYAEQVMLPREIKHYFSEVGATKKDQINPSHYTGFSVECIQITEFLPFTVGNAIKYAWRAGQKGDYATDIEKCKWYLSRAEMNGDMTTVLESAIANLALSKLEQLSDEEKANFTNYELVKQILTKGRIDEESSKENKKDS